MQYRCHTYKYKAKHSLKKGAYGNFSVRPTSHVSFSCYFVFHSFNPFRKKRSVYTLLFCFIKYKLVNIALSLLYYKHIKKER